MGFALAQAARQLGFKVTLIAGPVELPDPRGVKRIDVVSGEEMRRAVLREMKNAHIIIMAAAVADFRPARYSKKKIKKPVRGIKLKSNPDILEELGKKKTDEQTLVGFALETENMIANAKKKLKAKGCDWMVANMSSAIGSDESKATLIPRKGKRIALPRLPKHDLAMLILSHVL